MKHSDRNNRANPQNGGLDEQKDETLRTESSPKEPSPELKFDEELKTNGKSETMEAATKREPATRTGRKQLNQIEEKPRKSESVPEEETGRRKPNKLRIRLIPIWLRIIIVLVLIVIFFFIGAMIGYGVIGDGEPFDVFKKSTWTHILDIVNKET